MIMILVFAALVLGASGSEGHGYLAVRPRL